MSTVYVNMYMYVYLYMFYKYICIYIFIYILYNIYLFYIYLILYIYIYLYMYIYTYMYISHSFELRFFGFMKNFGLSGIWIHNVVLTVHTLYPAEPSGWQWEMLGTIIFYRIKWPEPNSPYFLFLNPLSELISRYYLYRLLQ